LEKTRLLLSVRCSDVNSSPGLVSSILRQHFEVDVTCLNGIVPIRGDSSYIVQQSIARDVDNVPLRHHEGALSFGLIRSPSNCR
jgi:hypothetical protein